MYPISQRSDETDNLQIFTLYFEELSYERVRDIYELEHASGIVVSVGGQLPQNIALRLQEEGKANVLGTNPVDIDLRLVGQCKIAHFTTREMLENTLKFKLPN